MPSADVFDAALTNRPDHEALVTRRGRWTYRELDETAPTRAGALADLGVRAGDRVAAVLPNEADIVVAFHGAMRLGAIWVGREPGPRPTREGLPARRLGASLLLCDAGDGAALVPHRGELPELRRSS